MRRKGKAIIVEHRDMKNYYQSLIRRLTSFTSERALLMAIADKETRWGTWPSEKELDKFEQDYFDTLIAGKQEWFDYAKKHVVFLKFLATSIGLCQIMPPTAVQYGMKEHPGCLYFPTSNLFWALQIIRALTEKYGKIREVALAYNGGSPKRGKPEYADEVEELYREYYALESGRTNQEVL